MKDSEILQSVLNALDISANKLSIELGFSSPASVYHVLNEKNSLSKDFKEKVIRAYPNVNYEFLRKATLPVLLDPEFTQAQMNLFNMVTVEEKEYEMFKNFINIPKKIKKMESEISELHLKIDQLLNKRE